jgi:hypothetical protein
MAEEKIYEKVDEAERIAADLCAKYPDVLWRVTPNKIAVLGITNRERSEKSKDLFKIAPIKGSQKALNIIYHVPISYIVEVFWSDWNEWTQNLKEWVMLKALLSVSENEGKVIKPDCREFRIILDIVGVDWEKKDDLPSLSAGGVPFNLDLRPAIEDEEEHDEMDEKMAEVVEEIETEEKIGKQKQILEENEDDDGEDTLPEDDEDKI